MKANNDRADRLTGRRKKVQSKTNERIRSSFNTRDQRWISYYEDQRWPRRLSFLCPTFVLFTNFIWYQRPFKSHGTWHPVPSKRPRWKKIDGIKTSLLIWHRRGRPAALRVGLPNQPRGIRRSHWRRYASAKINAIVDENWLTKP